METDPRKEFGQRVSRMRKYLNLTQQQLADKMNVTAKHISHVECGKANTSVGSLVALSEVFHCSLDYLIRGTGSDEIAVLQKIPCEVLEVLITGSEKEQALLDEFLKLYITIIIIIAGKKESGFKTNLRVCFIYIKKYFIISY